MSGWYTIKIDAWPFSTGDGQKVDQERAGPREREFTIRVADFGGAVAAAAILQDGIKSSGHVWEAPIRSIVYRGEMRP